MLMTLMNGWNAAMVEASRLAHTGVHTQDSFMFPLLSGELVQVRPLTPDDTARLADFYTQLSETTRWLRFFVPKVLDSETSWREAANLTRRNPQMHLAQVATLGTGDREVIVAVGEVVRNVLEPGMAELAIVVRDDYQGQGIGHVLGKRLIQVARQAGVKTLQAETLAENKAMHRLLRRIGVPFTPRAHYSEVVWTAVLDAA
jgi:RimJ/RimL family protein N-acetyltransferase